MVRGSAFPLQAISTLAISNKALTEAAIPPGTVVEKLKHYTARVSGITDPDQPRRQPIYLNALNTLPEVKIFSASIR